MRDLISCRIFREAALFQSIAQIEQLLLISILKEVRPTDVRLQELGENCEPTNQPTNPSSDK